jgi:hypothetical protein
MNKILYSPEALSDLDQIWTYINNELQNPAAAQKIIADILDAIEKCMIFRSWDLLCHRLPNLKVIIVFLSAENISLFTV